MDTPAISQTLATTTTLEIVTTLAPAELTPSAPPRSATPPTIGALGQVNALSEMEEADYQTCQAVIVMGWHSLVDVGLALARIQEGGLYRGERPTFAVYCRDRWQYSRDYVYRIISAARVFSYLLTNCQHC